MTFLHGHRYISTALWRTSALAGALLCVCVCAFPSAGLAGGLDHGSDHGSDHGLDGVRVERGDSPASFCQDQQCLDLRWIEVHHSGLDSWIGYDADEVSRPLPYSALRREREISLAVRLIVAEVGADRLLDNLNGVIEAIGILYTVDNRRVREIWNPLDARVRPFDGCGEGATFASCANREQYNGMGTWRALAPRSGYDPTLLAQALDVAVMAWVLQETGTVEDFTQGATNYVHRCGGSAYGQSTYHCDGSRARGIVDMPGAKAHTGPTLFRAPHEIAPAGYYRLHQVALIDYVRQPRSAVGDWVAHWEAGTN
jgi:hypothetical protein